MDSKRWDESVFYVVWDRDERLVHQAGNHLDRPLDIAAAVEEVRRLKQKHDTRFETRSAAAAAQAVAKDCAEAAMLIRSALPEDLPAALDAGAAMMKKAGESSRRLAFVGCGSAAGTVGEALTFLGKTMRVRGALWTGWTR